MANRDGKQNAAAAAASTAITAGNTATAVTTAITPAAVAAAAAANTATIEANPCPHPRRPATASRAGPLDQKKRVRIPARRVQHRTPSRYPDRRQSPRVGKRRRLGRAAASGRALAGPRPAAAAADSRVLPSGIIMHPPGIAYAELPMPVRAASKGGAGRRNDDGVLAAARHARCPMPSRQRPEDGSEPPEGTREDVAELPTPVVAAAQHGAACGHNHSMVPSACHLRRPVPPMAVLVARTGEQLSRLAVAVRPVAQDVARQAHALQALLAGAGVADELVDVAQPTLTRRVLPVRQQHRGT
jgi:hypothetical protein